jgi:hypothetical protein
VYGLQQAEELELHAVQVAEASTAKMLSMMLARFKRSMLKVAQKDKTVKL